MSKLSFTPLFLSKQHLGRRPSLSIFLSKFGSQKLVTLNIVLSNLKSLIKTKKKVKISTVSYRRNRLKLFKPMSKTFANIQVADLSFTMAELFDGHGQPDRWTNCKEVRMNVKIQRRGSRRSEEGDHPENNRMNHCFLLSF